MMERIEKMRVSDDALDLVFRKARTYNAWLPKPVPEEPTSARSPVSEPAPQVSCRLLAR